MYSTTGGPSPTLFNRFFGAIEEVETADEIEIDNKGNIQRIAEKSLKGEEPELEERMEKVQRIVSILSDVTILLKGGKPSGVDKQNVKIAKKICKDIDKFLKAEDKDIRQKEKAELAESLGNLTNKLVRKNILSATESFKKERDKAAEAINLCKRCMSDFSDTGCSAPQLDRTT